FVVTSPRAGLYKERLAEAWSGASQRFGPAAATCYLAKSVALTTISHEFGLRAVRKAVIFLQHFQTTNG
ncbi:hypothetical protein, partial [Rhodopseudomonas palustris]|uniref:hypothetical protein n=1 Tax=Rhodopseudomonas palustris TaxID=1076 RepID=UPI001AEC7613